MHQRSFILATTAALAALVCLGQIPGAAQEQDAVKQVLKDQARRIAAVKKVTPTVVAVFAKGGKGGGSGVLISKDGYALTNYHVVAPAGVTMKCGLADGHLYDAVLVGWDKVGDVALIKLLPKKAGEDFPYAKLGDSDKVREGDWSLAMGNPFLLATDFTPTVTFGLISGVHRYQYPAGTFLEYTDCIQIDTSINPGNSGGPLFNMDGELIGINGRGSFDKRGRVNSGVGYAISINQIKNFMGHLRAGLDCDHASLGAIVTTQTEASGLARLVVTNILEESDAARRLLDYDDEIVSFDGKLVTSVNQYLNIMGTYPRGWRVPLEYRRNGKVTEILVRLMGKQRRVLKDAFDPNNQPKKGPKINPGQTPSGPAAKFFKKKDGFANYYFNVVEKDRVMAAFKKLGDFSGFKGTWKMKGDIRLKTLNTRASFALEISPGKRAEDDVVKMEVKDFPYRVNPLAKQVVGALRQPAGSGGFLAAMYLYRRLLIEGDAGFSVECKHLGLAPIYPPNLNGKQESWQSQKQIAEQIQTRFGRFYTNWYFSPEDQKLVAFEVRIDEENEDPCEVYLSDYRPVDGRLLPHTIHVRYGNGTYGTISDLSYQLSKS